jgi:hypothetical protein
MTDDDPLRRGWLIALIAGLGRLDPPADVLTRAEACKAAQRAAERAAGRSADA